MNKESPLLFGAIPCFLYFFSKKNIKSIADKIKSRTFAVYY